MERKRSPIIYQVTPGARIVVDQKSHPGQFAWATVRTVIYAIKQASKDLPESYHHRKEPSMQLYLAMNAFSLTGYNYHPDSSGYYEPGTFFFATSTEGGGVTRKESEDGKNKNSHWKQDLLLK